MEGAPLDRKIEVTRFSPPHHHSSMRVQSAYAFLPVAVERL
jgi:hypothetical protein